MAESAIGIELVFDGVTVGNIKNLKLDGVEKDIFEVKYLDQNDRWKRKQGSFVDAKSMSVGISYGKTIFNSLIGKVDDEMPATLTLTAPDGSEFECDALLKSMAMDFPEDGGEITDDLVFELSGPPTFTAGA